MPGRVVRRPGRVRCGTGENLMVASDRPTIRHERREWWRRQLSRQQSENVSVTDFCRQLGVSISTFYYWKKRAHLVSSSLPARVVAERPSPPWPWPRVLFRCRSSIGVPVPTWKSSWPTPVLCGSRGSSTLHCFKPAIAAAGQLHGSGRRVE